MASSAKKKRFDMVSFCAAFDCWALAASAAGALPYTAALAHKRFLLSYCDAMRAPNYCCACIVSRILLQIAVRAPAENPRRRHHLSQYYDEAGHRFFTLCSDLLVWRSVCSLSSRKGRMG